MTISMSSLLVNILTLSLDRGLISFCKLDIFGRFTLYQRFRIEKSTRNSSIPQKPHILNIRHWYYAQHAQTGLKEHATSAITADATITTNA